MIVLCRVGHAQSIDLETAWQRIKCYAPSIAGADAAILAQEGMREQVGLLINPVLEVVGDNLGVGRPTEDVEPPTTTFSLSQTLELGGKRGARCRLASSEKCVAYWDAQIERADIYLALLLAFIDVRTAQEKWCIATKRLEVTEKITLVAKKQVENGKLSPIYEKRARIEMMAQSLAVREAFSLYEQAKIGLASMWGSKCPDFESVDFELYGFVAPPCESELLGCFYQTADFKKAQQIVSSASENISLQRANAIPDVTVLAGYRHFYDSRTGAFLAGVGIPIPLFNRNQGSVKSACAGLNQAKNAFEDVVRLGEEGISVTYARLASAYEESELMYRGIWKEAAETVQLTESGYNKGKFEYLDLLDAQKMLFEIQERYLDILYEYHQSRAELARISGMQI